MKVPCSLCAKVFPNLDGWAEHIEQCTYRTIKERDFWGFIKRAQSQHGTQEEPNE